MSTTFAHPTTGGPNQASYESITATFNNIFQHPDISPHQVQREIWWSQRLGALAVPESAEAWLWDGAPVTCERPLSSELDPDSATRLVLSHKDGRPFAAYTFSLGAIYNIIDPHGGEQLVEIKAPQHLENIATILSRVPAFNPTVPKPDAKVMQFRPRLPSPRKGDLAA